MFSITRDLWRDDGILWWVVEQFQCLHSIKVSQLNTWYFFTYWQCLSGSEPCDKIARVVLERTSLPSLFINIMTAYNCMGAAWKSENYWRLLNQVWALKLVEKYSQSRLAKFNGLNVGLLMKFCFTMQII